MIKEEKIPLNDAERDQLVSEIIDQALGYGPIERYLDDPSVTEVMVNSTDGVYIERDGKIELTDAQFFSEQHVLRVIDRIVAPLGRRIDESSPMVDARLPDGSRVNAVIPPLAIDGPQLTIRKFAARVLTLQDLMRARHADRPGRRLPRRVRAGTHEHPHQRRHRQRQDHAAQRAVVDDPRRRAHRDHRGRGGAAACSSATWSGSRAARPTSRARARSLARDLLRNALRMRPDRIVVGEVRGAEALDMLQAMNTGHDGSLSTLHANSPRDGLARVETMVLMAGFDLPVRADPGAVGVGDRPPRAHQPRSATVCGGSRVCASVDGMEGDLVTLSDVFVFEGEAGTDGRVTGSLRPTGVRPKLDRAPPRRRHHAPRRPVRPAAV